MKHLILFALVSGSATAVHRSELPVALVDGLLIEEAWASVQGGGAQVFLVINNRNAEGIGPIDVDVAGSAATSIVRTDGTAIEPTLPAHAELYMQPGGVRVEAKGIVVEDAVTVSVSLGEVSVTVEAVVLGADEPPPDHHDYDHG